MQSHLHGTWQPTLHREDIRHDYARANGPATVRPAAIRPDRASTALMRLRASLAALHLTAGGRVAQPASPGARTAG